MRKSQLFVTTAILATLLISNIVYAGNQIKIIFHNKEIQSDISPQLIKGKIMIPIQDISQVLGYDVKLNSQKNIVYINEKESVPSLVATLPEAGASLYAIEKNGYFTNFDLKVNDGIMHFPYWRSSNNRDIKLYYSDINNDGIKELIIILTTGTGTGVSEKEVHVINVDRVKLGGFMSESFVDNPLIVAMKNVKTKLTSTKVVITIGNKRTVVNIEKSGVEPSHLFKDIAYGSIIEFEVRDGELVAIIPTLLAPGGGSAGSIVINYEYKDKIYQAKKVSFVPNEAIAYR